VRQCLAKARHGEARPLPRLRDMNIFGTGHQRMKRVVSIEHERFGTSGAAVHVVASLAILGRGEILHTTKRLHRDFGQRASTLYLCVGAASRND